MEMVLTLRGLSVSSRVSLGPDVEILPISELAPSIARGASLGQEHPFPGQEFKGSSALLTTLDISPVVVTATDGRKMALDARRGGQFRSAQSLLSEACNCFVLFAGWSPAEHLTWSRLAHPGAGFLASAGWGHSGVARIVLAERALDEAKARAFFEKYYSIKTEIRERTLRVPIDRLARATTALNATDRAIELGVALEALLLRDDEASELSYRLSLRGAHLQGGDAGARRQLRKLLKKVYDLRSKAVHRGWIDPEKLSDGVPARQTIQDGANACAALIRLVIDRGGEVDFESLELGT